MKSIFKKSVALVMVAVMLLAVAVIGASADTTETPKYEQNKTWGDDGIFEIDSPEDLLAFAGRRVTFGQYAGITVRLTADIDLNPGWDASSGTAPTNVWATMFRFDGVLDGQGHTIKGLYSTGDKNGSNASFITNLIGASIKNLRVENSRFTANGQQAGFISCVKDDSIMENIYVDAIVETKGVVAGGILSWYYKGPNDTTNPKATLKSCVFAGSVTAKHVAGGLVGMVGSYANNEGTISPSQVYDIVMEDCANYGDISVGPEGQFAGGLVGMVPGNATFTRCYNAGSMTVVAGSNATLFNVTPKKDAIVTVTATDCYFKQASGLPAFTENDVEATTITLKCEGEDATELTALDLTALVEKNAFKTAKWEIFSDIAIPAGVAKMVRTHNYEAVVTPPTCSEKGYTTYTCKDEGCDASYVADYTDTTAHTESEEWIVDKEPTTEAAGSRHKECTVCGKTVKTEVLKKLAPETTEAPATEEKPVTEAPTTTKEPDTTTEEGGCGATVTAGVAGMALLLAGAALSLRKKEY